MDNSDSEVNFAAMAVYALQKELIFPPVDMAEPDGLLAMGGDLSIERLLLAYKNGIFPWYDGDVPLWWSPDPRFVLFPGDLKVSKSMQQVLKKQDFRFSINENFKGVIGNCKNIRRNNQHGTWITDEVEYAYTQLHEKGFAHSAEAWLGDELVGGMYGVRLGKVFFGESMFSKVSNASKYAFICYTQYLKTQGVALIDCQVYTAHLESLGAMMIPRKKFKQLLQQLL